MLDHQFGSNGDAAPVGDAPSRWIDRFSLATKLNIAIFNNAALLIFVTLAIIGGVAYLANAGQQQTVLASAEVRSGHAAIATTDAYVSFRDFSDRGQASGLQEASAKLVAAEEDLLSTLEYGGDAIPADIRAPLLQLRDRIRSAEENVTALDADADASAIASVEEEIGTLYRDLSIHTDELHDFVAGKAGSLMADIRGSFMIFFSLLAAGVLISMFGARTIVRNIVGMVRGMTDAMEKIAGGDQKVEIPNGEREDEIGAMARALAVFQQGSLELRNREDERAQLAEHELKQQQVLIDQSRDARTEKMDMLDELADDFEVSVGELIEAVAGSSAQLKSTSQSMAALAEQSSNQAGQASGAVDLARENVTAAASAADEFALSISEVSQQAATSAELARKASDLVDAANAKMSDLSGAANEVGEIVELIQTIAKRTNLLALNASIEAARGGEAGRGFAVVASEVKELANQTANATNSVGEKIGAIQSSTSASVADLDAIVKQIDELETVAVMIASAVDQQSMSGEDLARNIDTVARGAGDVAEQIGHLHDASMVTGSVSNQVLTSAEELDNHADALREKASRFIVDVRRSSREFAGEGLAKESA
ncbi:MAG: methyl-accepting chemotaxis protein [Pseudomonadota bacterium]